MDLTRRQALGTVGAAVLASGLAAAEEAHGRPGHVVLLGDSIFDNRSYVGNGPDVVQQVRAELPRGWKATLLAVDGAVVAEVPAQLQRLPADATHLVLSVGGNDALQKQNLLSQPAKSVTEVFVELTTTREKFAQDYLAMLKQVAARGKPTAVCTVYDPRFEVVLQNRLASTGLAVFNDGITRAAFSLGLPLLDLRLLFSAREDYANPIEPSVQGGAKLARTIRQIVTGHDFTQQRSAVYA